MIKKINKLIEDMPIIIKLILGIIMTGIITLCFFIVGVVQVSAAPTTYSLDAWSVGHNGSDSGPLANNTTYSWAWPREVYNTAYVNIIFTARNGTTTAHAKVETNFPNFCLFSTNVWEGNNKLNITVTKQCSGTNNNNVDYYFQMVSKQGQNITLQLKPIAPLTLLSNMSITAKVSGSQDVEISNDLTNDTFINATNNQTTTIVNNNNSNTQIISNAVDNSATNIINQMQDNLNLCKTYNYMNTPIELENKYLNETGLVQDLTGNNISEFIPINKNETYTLSINYSSAQNGRSYCLYRKDKSIISCQRYTQSSFTITPTDDGYIRYTINKTSTALTTELKGRYCKDRTEAEIEAIDYLRNTIMHQGEWEEEDDEVKNGLLRNIISGIGNIFGFLGDDELDNPDDSLNDLSSNMGTNNVISSLLLLPVSIYQSVVNNINGTCNSFNLGSLYNHNLTMTCIRPQDYLGSALWGVIDVIISGIFVLHIRKKFVDIFNHFTSLRTGGNELE